ncbi:MULTISPECIES: MFS transporter [unclassified Nonomuraea]|uniref:MFS transporter n=1 Tax=unclassified Nonomuraea TaxID=2593643 RepID=UPI0033F23678
MSRAPHDFRRAQLAVAALFCTLGFQYATWAARLPDIKARLGLSEAEVGLLLMACGVGGVLSFSLVPVLTKRLGSRRLALFSALYMGVLLIALAVAPNYPTALVIMCGDGIGAGALNVAMNAQGAALESRFRRTTMSRLHATFSGGALLGAVLASGATSLTPAVLVHFVLAAALILLLTTYARRGLLADAPPPEEPAPAKARRGLPVPTRLTVWMGCAMVFGTVTEASITDWSALYLKDVVSAPPQLVPMGVAVASVTMVTARVFADGWRSRWGDGLVVRAGSVLAGVGLGLALLTGGLIPTLLGFACVGIGIAAVTPCIYVAAARQGTDALALVASMGTTGLLAGPPIIGFIAGASSLVWGMGAVVVAALLVCVCATWIRWPAPAVEGTSAPAP